MEQVIFMPKQFTIEQKKQIFIESFIATNIARLCRRLEGTVAQFHRWRERFLKGGMKGLGESSKENENKKENNDLKS